MGRFIDMAGKKFTKITVLYQSGKSASGSIVWHCICECGNECDINGSSLRSGHTKSCGCLHEEMFSIINRYEFEKEYVRGYTTKNESFLISFEDYDRVKEYCWRKTDKGYIVSDTNDVTSPSRTIKLHRFIVNCEYKDGDIVDHINFDKSDNRRNNLRIITNQQNVIWKDKPSKSNTSGIIGVSKFKRDGTWVAYIDYNERIHIGTFDLLEDAIKSRLQKEYEIFKEFAPQQYLFSKYGIGEIND